jgi:hypothetical protein
MNAKALAGDDDRLDRLIINPGPIEPAGVHGRQRIQGVTVKGLLRNIIAAVHQLQDRSSFVVRVYIAGMMDQVNNKLIILRNSVITLLSIYSTKVDRLIKYP